MVVVIGKPVATIFVLGQLFRAEAKHYEELSSVVHRRVSSKGVHRE